jgi:class 3 adenylate cyclase/tetratricopeptide (TPR) repeat protein
MDLRTWLAENELGRYADAFVHSDIGFDVLGELTEADLKELGLSLGDRKRFLKAVSRLSRSPDQQSAGSPPSLEPTGPVGAERRQLTVLFCDLVNSTALSTRLDPEDMREIVGSYHRCVAEAVESLGGFVAKYMGDGVLAYFGYPKAREEEAECAVRAGLQLVVAVARLQAPEELRVRVGIATGLVVVGDLIGSGEARERGVVGETPNLAARLQSLAQPGTVVIDQGTRVLTRGLFEYEDLGGVAAKGFVRPIQAWRVLRPSAVEGRFEALHANQLPLIGRDEELQLLLRHWQQATTGDGCVVLISGEPGIGKSRLTAALLERLQGEPHIRLRYFCSPHHKDSALHPLITRLERAAGFARDDTPEIKRAKLDALLAPGSPSDEERALFQELLSLPTGSDELFADLSPQKRKERTLSALVGQLEALARRKPVLMLWEDVHWIDPTSHELLDQLIARVNDLRVLILVTFRPEFVSPWTGRAHAASLGLTRLGRPENTALIERIAGGRALPAEIVDQIIARTDGVPLFVEELTKAVLESGALAEVDGRFALTRPLPSVAVPTTLQASLTARLDRLGPLREVAQVGAVIGREFDHAVLAAVVVLGDKELRRAMEQLAAAELVFVRGTLPKATYIFKHALVQDAAYATLLRGSRQHLHCRIAEVLEGRFPEIVAKQPEMIAHHFSEGGIADKAARYWLQAGQLAARRSANLEAVSHLTRGIDAITRLPATSDSLKQELTLQLALGPALTSARGPGQPEIIPAYQRAHDLARQVGEPAQHFVATWGLWHIHQHRGQLVTARTFADELAAIAREHSDADFLLEAHHAGWTTTFHTPDFPACLDHVRSGCRLYDIEKHRTHRFTYGDHDPGICCLNHYAHVLWVLGYPDQAAEKVNESVALAEELEHPLSLMMALGFKCFVHNLRRDTTGTKEAAAALIGLTAEPGVGPRWGPTGRILLSWAVGMEERGQEAADEIRRGLREFDKLGLKMRQPYFLSLLADLCVDRGEVNRGLEAVEEAFRVINDTEDRAWESELYRMKGELLLLASPTSCNAESCFRRALDVAQRQHARSLELRAATSLARLWGDRGRRDEALDLLAPVHAWFTEGHSTPDLTGAKDLLNELAAGPGALGSLASRGAG